MNLAKKIDGKAMAFKIREELREKISQANPKPHLAVILAGDNEASKIYVRNKKKAADEIGIKCEIFGLPASISTNELETLIDKLNQDPQIDGILIQLPLPHHINTLEMLKRIDPAKDVDGFSPTNAGLLAMNSSDAVIAATPKGILYMLKSVCPDLNGKNAVVIGRSNIVGRPMASLLLNQNCTVSIVHSHTKNIQEITKTADIIIVACGCPQLVKKTWVKKDAIVIDVGINRVEDKLLGDVDFNEVSEIASHISPVPGGVGPMTIAMLLDNTYEANRKKHVK